METHVYKTLVKELGITVAEFERAIKVPSSTVSAAIRRGSKVTADMVNKIIDAYPLVNKDWLLTGKGDILLPPMSSMREVEQQYVKKGKNKEVIPLGKHVPLRLSADEYGKAFGDWPGLPMYNNPITASFIETYRDDTQYQPQYYLHDPRFRDCDFGAIITGDSMHAEIRHGDFVACKEVTDKRFIVFGDIYYVVANNGLETCKYLNADPDNKNNFLLIAKSERISPSPIPKDMILKLYKVRGIVRGY